MGQREPSMHLIENRLNHTLSSCLTLRNSTLTLPQRGAIWHTVMGYMISALQNMEILEIRLSRCFCELYWLLCYGIPCIPFLPVSNTLLWDTELLLGASLFSLHLGSCLVCYIWASIALVLNICSCAVVISSFALFFRPVVSCDWPLLLDWAVSALTKLSRDLKFDRWFSIVWRVCQKTIEQVCMRLKHTCLKLLFIHIDMCAQLILTVHRLVTARSSW